MSLFSRIRRWWKLRKALKKIKKNDPFIYED